MVGIMVGISRNANEDDHESGAPALTSSPASVP